MKKLLLRSGLILPFAFALHCGAKQKTETANVSTETDSLALEKAPLEEEVLETPAEEIPEEESILPEIETEVPPPVTFVLKNTSEEPLVLSLDHGWQPVIFAYSGKPPRAKSILMFPTHCTASCEAEPTEICPVCEKPEKVKDVLAAENHHTIEPGTELEVPWDGFTYDYTKTKGEDEAGKKTRCKCWSKVPVEEKKYTVKSCGLRLTQDAKKRSKYSCTKSSMEFPVEEPIRVELELSLIHI